jgi:aldose 1-epimerase
MNLLSMSAKRGSIDMRAAIVCAVVTHAPYGVTARGEPVDAFTLTNGRGIVVRVLTYGGVINEISVPDRKGSFGNIVVSLPDLKAYEGHANFSSLLGRYANRIADGGFTLNGVRYNLPSNAQGISSHGGPGGFSTKVWHAAPIPNGVVLSYESADGENGYPGNLSVTVEYTLTDALQIRYTARTDKPTVVNLSHHVYFNLAGSETILGESLQIFADRYTVFDARKIPTGEMAPVAGTALDFRQPAVIRDFNLDHNFVLNGPAHLAARLSDPVSGRRLEIRTTEPGIQVFTGRKAGVALETQHFPNSPNQPTFPSTELRPGQVFQSETQYRFSVF